MLTDKVEFTRSQMFRSEKNGNCGGIIGQISETTRMFWFLTYESETDEDHQVPRGKKFDQSTLGFS